MAQLGAEASNECTYDDVQHHVPLPRKWIVSCPPNAREGRNVQSSASHMMNGEVSVSRGREAATSMRAAHSRECAGPIQLRGEASASGGREAAASMRAAHQRRFADSTHLRSACGGQQAPASESGAPDATTIVVKNIPCRCTIKDLLRTVEDSGFLPQFEYMYVPVKPNSALTRGYAFVRFRHQWQALTFQDAMSGLAISCRKSEKRIQVEVSAVTHPLHQLVQQGSLQVQQSLFGPVLVGSLEL